MGEEDELSKYEKKGWRGRTNKIREKRGEEEELTKYEKQGWRGRTNKIREKRVKRKKGRKRTDPGRKSWKRMWTYYITGRKESRMEQKRERIVWRTFSWLIPPPPPRVLRRFKERKINNLVNIWGATWGYWLQLGVSMHARKFRDIFFEFSLNTLENITTKKYQTKQIYVKKQTLQQNLRFSKLQPYLQENCRRIVSLFSWELWAIMFEWRFV